MTGWLAAKLEGKVGRHSVHRSAASAAGSERKGTTMTTTSFQPTGYHDQVEDDFAEGAARYLRRAGLDTDAITTSLTAELGLDRDEARRFAAAA